MSIFCLEGALFSDNDYDVLEMYNGKKRYIDMFPHTSNVESVVRIERK